MLPNDPEGMAPPTMWYISRPIPYTIVLTRIKDTFYSTLQLVFNTLFLPHRLTSCLLNYCADAAACTPLAPSSCRRHPVGEKNRAQRQSRCRSWYRTRQDALSLCFMTGISSHHDPVTPRVHRLFLCCLEMRMALQGKSALFRLSHGHAGCCVW